MIFVFVRENETAGVDGVQIVQPIEMLSIKKQKKTELKACMSLLTYKN